MTIGEYMAAIPENPGSNSPWGVRYGRDIRDVIKHTAAHAPRSVQRHLGPSELGSVCLSGETEVVTRQGLRKIRDLAKEGNAELLIPMLYRGSGVRKRWGKFQQVPVECFGEQELLEITLRRNQETKTVFATADHHWFRSYYSGKIKTQKKLETRELLPGYRLTQLRRAMPRSTTLMPFAIAQGFVFGDGTKGTSDDRHRPATLNLFHNGKDEALLGFFPGEHRVERDAAHAHAWSKITGLPRFWKNLPPIDESVSFLMSWLAGYFAADGCVTDDGHCSISSAYRENLEFVRNIAAICGIGYGQIQRHMRRGISGAKPAPSETPLYKLGLRRRDLPNWFFLTAQHAERVRIASLAPERDPHWIVESVRATGRTELVYCAVTGDVGAFALADDLMTGNCDRQIVGKIVSNERPDDPSTARTNNVSDPWPAIIGTAVHAWLAAMFEHENDYIGFKRYLTELRVAPTPDHPGSTDLYDRLEAAVVDHKVLGPTSLAKIRSGHPPRKYFVQLLLYGLGCQLAGLPVRRVVILAYPRTAATLDSMYVWDHPVWSENDAALLWEVLRVTEVRKKIASEVLKGVIDIRDVPITPDDTECFFLFCPFYRPQSARDGGPGCPGTIGHRDLISS